MVDDVKSSPVTASSGDVSADGVGGERKVDERDVCGGGRRERAVLRWLDVLRWDRWGFALS